MGAVTWSPGAILLKVTSADVGLVDMLTVPVVNVLAATLAVLVNRAEPPLAKPASSPATTNRMRALRIMLPPIIGNQAKENKNRPSIHTRPVTLFAPSSPKRPIFGKHTRRARDQRIRMTSV